VQKGIAALDLPDGARGGEDSVAYARQIRDRRDLPEGAGTLGFALLAARRVT
jgi:hypothetical protein